MIEVRQADAPSATRQGAERRRPSTSEARREAVERVVRLMRTEFAETLSLPQFADVAMISPFHLHRVFIQVTGVSPGRYLTAVRMDAAKRLLLHSNLRVMDVCSEVGYTSLGTFTSQFTALVGVQPRRFRRLARALAAAPITAAFRLETSADAVHTLSGEVVTGDDFAGWACLGMFATRIPQGLPASCTLAKVPGPFTVDKPLGDDLHLLAIALPTPDMFAELLVPNQRQIRVGCVSPPVPAVSRERADLRRLVLRPLQTTDPPIVLALPLLLALQPKKGESWLSGRSESAT